MMKFDSATTGELNVRLHELKKQETVDSRAMVDCWVELGKILDEVRNRHLTGKLGKSSWATYCRKEYDLTKTLVDRYIATSRAKDPYAYLEKLLQEDSEKKSRSRGDKTREHTGPIIIKRPGVIFGYLVDLDDAGKAEFFALCWRNYPKLMRRVGDSVGVGDVDYEREDLKTS
jgi:hypothetical protein